MSDKARTLKVETAESGGRSVVQVSGDVDLRSSPRLRDLLLASSRGATGPWLVDLSGVGYMDSSGVGTMVFLKREVERAGRSMVLIGLQPRVLSLFEITHLDKFFTLARSLGEVEES